MPDETKVTLLTPQPPTLVVLGAAVWANGPSPALARRVDHAAALWRRDPHTMIIVCGGLGQHPPTEAQVMRDLLVDLGVPEHMILREDQSTTTLENLQNAQTLLTHPSGPIVVVSDRYHLPRSLLVCRALGITATGNGPRDSTSRKGLRIKQITREVIGYPIYALRLWLRKNQ